MIPPTSAEFLPGIVYPGLLFHRVGGPGQQRLQSRLVCAPFRSFRRPQGHPRSVREILCSPLRHAALKRAYDLILIEDGNTNFQDLGPINKMINFIVQWYVDGPESDAFRRHRRRRADFMWLGKEGMMMAGTNGSQLWGIAFIS